MQLTLEMAQARGEDGMRRAAEHAERVTPGITDLLFLFLEHWAIAQPKDAIFTAEAITDAYANDPGFVQPTDQRAWGAVVKRALRLKIIKHVDNEGIRLKGNHSRGASRYRSLVSGKKWTEGHK